MIERITEALLIFKLYNEASGQDKGMFACKKFCVVWFAESLAFFDVANKSFNEFDMQKL